jgi:hypothetical protein
MQRSQVTTVGLISPTNIPYFAERYFCLIVLLLQAEYSKPYFLLKLDTHHGIIESDLLNFSPSVSRLIFTTLPRRFSPIACYVLVGEH